MERIIKVVRKRPILIPCVIYKLSIPVMIFERIYVNVKLEFLPGPANMSMKSAF